MDVNRPTTGPGTTPIVIAVVGSMDGLLGQYCAHISACATESELGASLDTAFTALLETFAKRHGGKYPKRMLIYREGVADNQFCEVLEDEVPFFKQGEE